MTRPIAVVDCETDPFRAYRVPRPFVWGYYDGKRYRQYPEKPGDIVSAQKSFVRFLKKQDAIVYAHNGGRFDWHFLLPEVNPFEDILIINGRIAKVMIGLADCRDSFNILPVPLAAYKKDDIDYDIMEKGEREKSHNWKKISDYLRSDCVYLHELISRFVSMYGVQITQASAAMHQWKKLSKMSLPHTNQRFYELLSPYYYGGRVQCFRSGIIDTDFSVFDINSAYPYAMLHDHPYSEDFTHVDGYDAGAHFYRVSCVSRGAFPFRGLGEGTTGGFGLRFPSDSERRIYTVSRWEYRAAKDTGTIEKPRVLESITFSGEVNFSEYINTFYAARLKAIAEKDAAASLFTKLLMNSLYGKFAANPDNYRNYMVVPMDMIAGLDGAGWSFAGEMGPWGLAESPLQEDQKRYYNVATGASITGFVRAMLWRAICSSKGVLYCDTDSIAVEKAGAAVSLGDRLGQWKHEGDFDRAGIAGKKLYIFRGVSDGKGNRTYKTASKGARLTLSQLWAVASGKNVDYIPDVPTFSPQKQPEFVKRRIKFTA